MDSEMAKATKEKEEGLSEMLGVRVSKGDLERLDALAERLELCHPAVSVGLLKRPACKTSAPLKASLANSI